MELTATSASFELTATADLTSAQTTGSATIGTGRTSVVYNALTPPDVAYSLKFQIQGGQSLTLDLTDGTVTGALAGTPQVETLTAAGTVSASGNAKFTLTGSRVTGSPLEISFAVTSGDTASVWAGKGRTALNANSAVTSIYTVGGSGTSITLTSIEAVSNDSSLVLAVANDTSTGITAASSANTTAGVMANKAYRINGQTWDNTDFQGVEIPTMTKLHSVLIQATSQSSFTVNGEGMNGPFVIFQSHADGNHPWNGGSISIFSDEDQTVTIDIQAGE